MHDADLLREIAAAPDRATPYLVYADRLLHRGDPHGELIVVQHALETADGIAAVELRRREAELFEAHLDEWLGEAAPHRDCLTVRWQRGFVVAARVRMRLRTPRDRDAAAPLRALLASPIARALSELRFGPHSNAGENAQPLVDALCAQWPAALRRLYIGDVAWHEIADCSAIDLSPLADAVLDELWVQARAIAIWDSAPAIRRLTLRAPEFKPRELARTSYAGLEKLSILCAKAGPLDWLRPALFPNLVDLGLTGATDADSLAFELVKHPITSRLHRLDLYGGVMTEWGAGSLARANRLPPLDVRCNLIPTDACARLRERGDVLVEPQRLGRTGALSSWEELRDHEYRLRTNSRSSAAWRTTLEEGSDRALVEYFAAGDPRWGDEHRFICASSAPAPFARALLRDLEASWHVDFSDRLRTSGPALCLALAKACEGVGDLAGAECALWGAVHHARWYRWRDDCALLDQIATLQLRAGHLEGAVPLRERVLAQIKCDLRAHLELAFAELACGRPAHAEARGRSAFEIAPQDPRAGAALGALVWARHDVESVARGAWVFAAYQAEPALLAEVAPCNGVRPHYTHQRGPLGGDRVVAHGKAEHVVAGSRAVLGERDAIADALLGELALGRHHLARAAAYTDAALPRAPAIALGVRARIAIARGDYAGARADADAARELHHADGHRFGEAIQLAVIADAALGDARYAEAAAIATDAIEMLAVLREYPAIATLRLRLGWIAQLRGDRAGAERHYLEAIVEAERDRYLRLDRRTPAQPEREHELVARAQLWLALVHAQDARPDEAYALLGRARPRLRRFEPLAMASAVIARYAGGRHPLPDARSLESRLIQRLLA